MLAYRKSDFDALARGEAIGRWAKDGILDAPSANSLAGKFPSPFYSPNIFVRIGLFLFASVCSFAAFGLFFLMFGMQSSETGLGFMLIVFGAGLAVVSETLARRTKPFFRAGLEEAALYGALGCLLSGWLLLTRASEKPHFLMALVFAGVFAAAAIRYADSLLAAKGLALGFYALFDLCHAWGEKNGVLVSLLAILVSTVVVKGCGWALAKENLLYWEHLWKVLRFLALLTAYLAGNYFVVREVGPNLFGLSSDAGRGPPLSAAFNVYTFGLPLIYLAFGLFKKDRLFLAAGLLTLAMAAFTFKYYHHVLPVETGLIFAGAVLIGLAWIALRIFKTERYGITASWQRASVGQGILNAESLALLNGFVSKEAPTQTSGGFKGEGGAFGGGGAGGNF